MLCKGKGSSVSTSRHLQSNTLKRSKSGGRTSSTHHKKMHLETKDEGVNFESYEAEKEDTDEDEDEDTDEADTADVECEMIHLKINRRPKASNLDNDPKRVLMDAKNEMRARLATIDAYPSADDMNDWIIETWANANKRLFPGRPPFESNGEINKMVS
jgi:hypothetical protein